MADETLSATLIRELLHYDPKTGIFIRKVRMAQCHQVGDRADVPGHAGLKGYRTIGMFGQKYLAHRVAWIYVHGKWPDDEIDHKDGDGHNNRIKNLRDASSQLNKENQRRSHSNKKHTHLMGAYYLPQAKTRPWCARITVGKKRLHLGVFATPQEAHAAYVAAKRKLHEGCTI